MKKPRFNLGVRKSYSILFISVLLLLIQSSTPFMPVNAELGVFQETFNTTTYKDVGNTNVTGWGSGAIKSPNKSLEFAGAFDTSGNVRGIDTAGDLLFLADLSTGLQILDLSDPTTPVLTGYYNSSLWAEDVHVSGDYAFIADLNGVWVLNITVPSTPTFIDYYNTPASPEAIFVDGDYIFVADSFSGLQILNATDVTDLSLLGVYDTANAAEGIFVEGDYAFVAYGVDGLVILDITDVENPTYLGSYDSPGYARDVYVAGNQAFLADSDYGLQVIDITDPTNPTLSGTYNTAGFSRGVFVSGNHAFIADENDGLVVIDVEDVSNPVQVDAYNTPGHSYSVVVEGNYAFIADNNGGLQVVTLSESIFPKLMGFTAIPDIPSSALTDIFTSGNLAYVVGNTSLRILNITDPKNPQILGNCPTPGYSSKVKVAGDLAFIADGLHSGFHIANVSDSQNPYLISFLNSTKTGRDLSIAGNLAFNVGSYGFSIVDITDVMNPVEIGSYSSTGAASIDTEGDIAAIANRVLNNLQIVDISNPQNPSLLGAVNVSEYLGDIWIEGDYVYICSQTDGFHIVDIRNPRQPIVVSKVTLPSFCDDVFVEGDLAFLSQFGYGFVTIDITDPLHPFEVNRLYSASGTLSASIEGEHAYVLTRDGLEVVQVSAAKYRIIEPTTVAQSTTIFSAPVNTSFSAVILTEDAIVPTGTSVSYFLSPNNGVSWEEVNPDAMHTFGNTGRHLKWKVELSHNTTSSWDRTAEISQIYISYNFILESPGVTPPGGGTPISNNQPFFNWEDIPGAVNYSFQLDTVNSFDSSNLMRLNVSASSYTPSSPLADGPWYWSVAAIDSTGEIGFYSEPDAVSIDTQAPLINNPADVSIQVGTTGNTIVWSPSDDHPLDFSVTRDGSEINSGPWNGETISINVDGLSIGTYTYICLVRDTLEQTTSDTVIVTVNAAPTTTTSSTPISGLSFITILMLLLFAYYRRPLRSA